MQPYRLEMGTRLPNPQGGDLYSFWGETLTRAVNKALKAQGDDVLINLASNEYFKSIKPKLIEGRRITSYNVCYTKLLRSDSRSPPPHPAGRSTRTTATKPMAAAA